MSLNTQLVNCLGTLYNGYTFRTENKKMKKSTVSSFRLVLLFTQRLEMPQGAFFAEFNVKEVKLNQQLGDDVFAVPN
jgi:hypothetical protein